MGGRWPNDHTRLLVGSVSARYDRRAPDAGVAVVSERDSSHFAERSVCGPEPGTDIRLGIHGLPVRSTRDAGELWVFGPRPCLRKLHARESWLGAAERAL